MKARYEENVQIELIDINNVEGREDWLQQVAEVLQIFPPEDGPLTTNMFFTAVSATADALQFEKISTEEIEKKARIDRSISELREEDKLVMAQLRMEDKENIEFSIKQAEREEKRKFKAQLEKMKEDNNKYIKAQVAIRAFSASICGAKHNAPD